MCNRIRPRVPLTAIAFASACGSLLAPGAASATPVTIDNGYAQLQLDMTNGAGAATYIRPGGHPTQLISQMSWFYRVDGDSQEHRFGTPDGVSVSAGMATFQWNMSDFVATLVVDLIGRKIIQSMTIENTTTDTLGVSVFSYFDIDPGFAFWSLPKNDKVILEWINSGTGAIIRAFGTELGAANDAALLLGLLEDSALTDFSKFGIQSKVGDTALVFQWSEQLEAGASFTGSMSAQLMPPPTAALLGSAAFTCLAARRRRPI